MSPPVIVLVRPLSLAGAGRPLAGGGSGEQNLFAHFKFYSETCEGPEQQEKQEACGQTDSGSHLSVQALRLFFSSDLCLSCIEPVWSCCRAPVSLSLNAVAGGQTPGASLQGLFHVFLSECAAFESHSLRVFHWRSEARGL